MSVLSGAVATSVSKISAVTRKVWMPSACPGSRPGGSASIPTTSTSRGVCAEIEVACSTMTSAAANGVSLDIVALSSVRCMAMLRVSL